MRSFPVAGYLDGNDMLFAPLSSNHILYFEWHRSCALSLGELVRIRRQWSRCAWGARCDRAPPKVRLVELVVLNDSLLARPRLLRAPSELDLWQACNGREARYTARLFGMMDMIRVWLRWTRIDVAPLAMLWLKWLLPPEF